MFVNYRYIESIARKTVLSKLVISCHTYNLKSIHADYIYHKMKRANPVKWICPAEDSKKC